MLANFPFAAAVAGVAVAAAAAPLGCFVVWRRMAYYGDATAHAAILGVVLSLALSLPIIVGTLIVALAMALLVAALDGRGQATDTLLGVFSHSALAVGLVAASFLSMDHDDLEHFLFGDILAVTVVDVIVICGGALLVFVLVCWRWSPLLMATLNPDFAQASGVDPRKERFYLTIALAVVVAVAIEVVGALLITALLVIPAAAARPLGDSPERMAFAAVGIGVLAALLGLLAAMQFGTPAGPSIVCAAASLFAVTTVIDLRRR